jgi:hypothetical protein
MRLSRLSTIPRFAFQACSFNHSDISPFRIKIAVSDESLELEAQICVRARDPFHKALPKKELQKSIRTASEGRTQELDEIPTALLEYFDGDVARRRAVEHLASVRVVAAEVIERKWSGPCVHESMASSILP